MNAAATQIQGWHAAASGPWFARGQSLETSGQVWDRLWKNANSAGKDTAILARERRNPRWTVINQALEDALGSVAGRRCLELGSGRGDLSAILAQKNASVTLLDNSAAALALARDRFGRLGLNARFVDGNILATQTSNLVGFDVSMSLGVIEHFRGAARDRVLRAHYDVLRPGGVSVIGVPNASSPPYRLWKLCLETIGWWPYGLEIPYTRRELTARARRVGFTDVCAWAGGFWQSVGDFWVNGVCRTKVDWVGRRSRLDRMWGANLLLIARRPSK